MATDPPDGLAPEAGPTPLMLRVLVDRAPRSVRLVRRAVAGALASTPVPSTAALELLLAVSEAATNAVQHGEGPDLEVAFAFHRDAVEIRVRQEGGHDGDALGDSGSLPSLASIGGRGLPIIARLVDEVEIEPRPSGGSELVLRRRLASAERSLGARAGVAATVSPHSSARSSSG